MENHEIKGLLKNLKIKDFEIITSTLFNIDKYSFMFYHNVDRDLEQEFYGLNIYTKESNDVDIYIDETNHEYFELMCMVKNIITEIGNKQLYTFVNNIVTEYINKNFL